MPAVTSRWCHGAPRVLRTSRSGIAACDVVSRVDATRCDVQRCTGRAAKSQTIVAMFRRQRLPGRPPTPNVFLAGRPRRRAQRCPFAALIHIARLALASRLATMRRTPLRRVAISADDHGAWPRLQLVRLILCRQRLVARRAPSPSVFLALRTGHRGGLALRLYFRHAPCHIVR